MVKECYNRQAAQRRITKRKVEKEQKMLFCSETFIFGFLPVFLLIYYIVPERFRNLTLFLGSLWFYIAGERTWFFLIVLTLGLHFAGTTLMKGKTQKLRKGILILLLLYDFGTLFVFKYLPFFVGKEHLTWSLPLGISFYTFQIAAYAIDVYRRPEEYEQNFVNLGTYLCMFPQLIAGPIVLFKDVAAQLKERKVNMQGLEEGLKIFTVGLGYKMLIANVL